MALAMATTAGAQVAVTPVLVAVFGTVPIASFANNVLETAVRDSLGLGPSDDMTCGALAGLDSLWVTERSLVREVQRDEIFVDHRIVLTRLAVGFLERAALPDRRPLRARGESRPLRETRC